MFTFEHFRVNEDEQRWKHPKSENQQEINITNH